MRLRSASTAAFLAAMPSFLRPMHSVDLVRDRQRELGALGAQRLVLAEHQADAALAVCSPNISGSR